VAAAEIEALFLPVGDGRRFGVARRPRGAGVARRGAVLSVHAFGEEMNKSRHMAALQADALAASGFEVLQLDLFGCGDSSGDFGDATWTAWLQDVEAGWQWLRERTDATIWIWGHRTGCLLACECAARRGQPASLLLWQPVASGKAFLAQFLRTKIIGQALAEGESRSGVRELRESLTRGDALEVAGYRLSPDLALPLERSELMAPPAGSRVRWFEIVASASDEPSPAARQRAEAWRHAGVEVALHAVAGPAFWQTQEITECPPLIEASIAALR
jgi:exosortase A-associated hydrolase 2